MRIGPQVTAELRIGVVLACTIWVATAGAAAILGRDPLARWLSGGAFLREAVWAALSAWIMGAAVITFRWSICSRPRLLRSGLIAAAATAAALLASVPWGEKVMGDPLYWALDIIQYFYAPSLVMWAPALAALSAISALRQAPVAAPAGHSTPLLVAGLTGFAGTVAAYVLIRWMGLDSHIRVTVAMLGGSLSMLFLLVGVLDLLSLRVGRHLPIFRHDKGKCAQR